MTADVSGIVTLIDNNKTLIENVYAAKPGGFNVPIASDDDIVTNLDSVFPSQIWPHYLPEEAELPAAVYQLADVDIFDTDGYRLTQTNNYRITIYTASTAAASDAAQFDTKMREVITALQSSDFTVEVFGMGVQGYSDEHKALVGFVDVEYTYYAKPDNTAPGNDASEFPVVLVYPVSADGSPSEYDNLVKQRHDNQYGFVILTVDGNIEAIRAELRGIVLGYAQTQNYFDMEYVSGQNLGGVSNLELWREVYTDGIFYSE